MALPLTTPSKLTAGVTAEWLRSLADFPASDWQLTYNLVRKGATITITAGQYAGTETHHIRVTHTEAARWIPGIYHFQATVSDGTNRHIVEQGSVEILPDFASMSEGHDGRSFAKRCLDNIEAVLEKRAGQAQLEYSIAGRMLKFIPHEELMKMRNQYLVEYRAECCRDRSRKTGRSPIGRVKVRFR
ncbi:MAG: hypothetical protein LWW75_07010 [Chlorobiales bacterium]|nr:hypothetical protein [Chlorobiales bacterium]